MALPLIGGAHGVTTADPAKPVLISEANSTRAIALEAVTLTREPFSIPSSSSLYGSDHRTRVMLFAMNLALQPGEDLSVIAADAEDQTHRHYDLKVEDVRKVPGQEWMSQVILRLNESLGDAGDVLVGITYRGVTSNRVRIAVGHVGGGPPDDAGAAPTPAPPYTISGRITSGGTALSGVSVALSGSQTGTVATDNSGAYSFTVTAVGNYTITPSKLYYAFTPASKTLNDLSGNRTADFDAAPVIYTLSGQIKDNNNKYMSGVTVTLGGTQQGATISDVNGNYSFTVMAGGNYTVTPSKPNYSFTPSSSSFANLSSSQTPNFVGTLNTYSISGKVTDGANGISDVILTLSGSVNGSTTTDANGNYSFPSLAAGGNYTVTPSKINFTFSPSSETFNNLSDNVTGSFTGALVFYSISGRVIDSDNNNLANVLVTLSTGSGTSTTTTNEAGFYTFSAKAQGNYTIKPSAQHYTFTPSSQTFNNLSGNQTSADFRASLVSYTISGMVRDAGLKGMSGVVVKLSGARTDTTTTDANGHYSFTNITATRSYSITASRANYIFSPSQITIASLDGDRAGDDFTGTLLKYSISGYIADHDRGPLSGVRVALSGPFSREATTNNDGKYAFTELPAEANYTVTASAEYYNLTPQNLTFNFLGGNQTDANFTATRILYTISGQVKDDQGSGLDAATVTLGDGAGSASKTAITSHGGNFSFTDIPAGYSYTVTPLNTSVFTFTTQSTGNLTGSLMLNFTGTRRNYTISGQVADGTNGIGGVMVTLSGGSNFNPRTSTTTNSGNFSFTDVPAGFDYIVKPLQTAFYTFIPQSFSFLSVNQTTTFAGTLRSYSVSGRVTTDGNTALSSMTVIIYNTNYSVIRYAATNTDGVFSFMNVPAAGTYTVFPLDTVLYSFASQSVQNLGADQTLNFTSTRRTYTITGTVADQAQNGLSGVTVTLTGSLNRTATTNAQGYYAFNNLPSGDNYQITLLKTDYIFNPPSQNFIYLDGDQKADFIGRRTYTISGRVTDNSGNGLIGITMTLAGPQTVTALTNSDGDYSLFVTTVGDYTLTPFKEQNYYTFTPPNQLFRNFSSNQTANFAGTLTPITKPSYVLEFDGSPMTVDYGDFWPSGVDLGHFFWEFWAMPGDNNYTRYLLSDGYGGAHALLFGFSGGTEPGRYTLYGNIWSGPYATVFMSDEGPAPGEWGYFAVGWDGKNVITYFDGVPVGKQAFAGPRRSIGPASGGGRLFVGGSDHLNLIGRIAQVRGFEGSNPREGSPEASFAPQTIFDVKGNFLSYYFRPAQSVADLSPGYNGSSHVGKLCGVPHGFFSGCSASPLPRFVIDPSAPDFSNPTNPGQITAPVDTPLAIPGGAMVFDSFSRRNSTYVLGGMGGLGSTEGGAAGPQVWQTGQDSSKPQPFGILNGRAVLLANDTCMAWVPTGSTTGNLDIRVDRHPRGGGSGVNTGISFRVIDTSNYFFAYTNDSDIDPSKPQTLSVGYYQSGSRTDLATGLNMPANWTTLRVVTTNDGNINVYADATLVYSATSSTMATATRAGLYNNTSGMGLTNRWDNFTVYGVP